MGWKRWSGGTCSPMMIWEVRYYLVTQAYFNRTKAPLLFTYAVHYFATRSGVKCVDCLDPRGPTASCYAAYGHGFITW